ncbi:MAG: hypothetical protein HC902_14250 [Calothrix sp. SM1_5_4]|nr:hypothetical protein [Calothrix sp. SM1_5_4]
MKFIVCLSLLLSGMAASAEQVPSLFENWRQRWTHADTKLDRRLVGERARQVEVLAQFLLADGFPARQMVILDDSEPNLARAVDEFQEVTDWMLDFYHIDGFIEHILGIRDGHGKSGPIFRHSSGRDHANAAEIGRSGFTLEQLEIRLRRELALIKRSRRFVIVKVPLTYLEVPHEEIVGVDFVTKMLPRLARDMQVDRFRLVFTGGRRSWNLLGGQARANFERSAEENQLMIMDMGRLLLTRSCEDALTRFN